MVITKAPTSPSMLSGGPSTIVCSGSGSPLSAYSSKKRSSMTSLRSRLHAMLAFVVVMMLASAEGVRCAEGGRCARYSSGPSSTSWGCSPAWLSVHCEL